MKKTNDLQAFLRKHGALRKFKAAYETRPSKTWAQAEEIGKTDCFVICGAFVWDDTTEGHKYWDRLDGLYAKQFSEE